MQTNLKVADNDPEASESIRETVVVGKRIVPEQQQLSLPLGARFFAEVRNHALEDVRALANTPEGVRAFEAMASVLEERSDLNFLHSAMCAMSLPIKRPKDEMAPIIRQDGNYSLIIQPLERMEPVGPDGAFVPVRRGVPFGKHARLVLLYIMTEAVTRRSREIYLGDSFSAFLRRMKIANTSSGGSRGTRALVQEQVDRLMSCEWTMRWDERISGRGKDKAKSSEISAFATNDMRLANGYAGMRTKDGDFISHFVLSEAFYENLIKHSVPFNERAIVALKDSATKLDLYTWLSYRLPRIAPGQEISLTWEDLAKHLGNESSTMTRFRQTVREAWDDVSGVYQQAGQSVDFSTTAIKLRHAAAPTDGHMILAHDTGRLIAQRPAREPARRQGDLLAFKDEMTNLAAELPPMRFPASGHLRFSAPELYEIGVQHGSGNDVSVIAEAFRRSLGEELATVTGEKLIRRWRSYCEGWGKAA